MSNFGDVRAAVQDRSLWSASRLTRVLYHYKDDTPPSIVLSYIIDNWGWCPASTWSNYWTTDSHLNAVHRYQTKKPLFAQLYIGPYAHQVLRLDKPEDAIQKVLAIRRQECLDRVWLLYAARNPSADMDAAVELLQGCVNTHTNYDYRQEARRAVAKVIGWYATDVQNRELWRAAGVITERSMKQMLQRVQPLGLSTFSSSTIAAALLGGWP